MGRMWLLALAVLSVIVISGCTSSTEPSLNSPEGNEAPASADTGGVSGYYDSVYVSDECQPPPQLGHDPRPVSEVDAAGSHCIILNQSRADFRLTIKTFRDGAIVGNIVTMDIQNGYSSMSPFTFGLTPGAYQVEFYADDDTQPFRIVDFVAK